MEFNLASIALPRRHSPVRLLSAIARVTAISPLHVLRGRRVWALGIIVALPPLLVALLLAFGVRDAMGAETFRVFVSGFYVNGIFPLVCLFVGAAAIGDDIDDGTVLYLRLRPIPRAAVVFGRFFAAALSALALFAPSLCVLYALQFGGLGPGSLGRNIGMLGGALLGAVTSTVGFCTLFLLLGLATRRAVIIGIVLVVLQDILIKVPGSAAWLSVNLYTQVVLDHFDVAHSGFEDLLLALDDAGYLPSFGTALLVVAAGMLGLLSIASAIFSSREYLEKPGE